MEFLVPDGIQPGLALATATTGEMDQQMEEFYPLSLPLLLPTPMNFK